MDGTVRRVLLRAALLLSVAALLVCGALGVLIAWTPARASAAELRQAEARWAARSFRHYQLELRDKNCLQVIEVLDERVVKVAPNRCEPPPRTVTDLFTLIRRDGTVSVPCIAHRCACDDVISVRAVYDSALGFPASIEVRVTAQPNMQHPDYWIQLVENRRPPDCSVLAEGSKLMAIDSITPLR